VSAFAQVVLGCALNACWQLPLIVLFCHLLVRTSPARVQHWVWLLATLMAVVLPMGGLWGLYSQGRSVALAPGPVPPSDVAQRIALAAWALASAYAAARFARTAIASRRARRRSTPLGKTRGVELRLSPPELESAGPLLIGIWRPTVLIPAFLNEPANAGLLRAALAHELAHVRRNDMLAYVLSKLALIPLAFHPAAWWLRHRLSESRELACDEQAARETSSPIDYARALLEIGRRALHPAPLHSLGVADGGMLERRIRALVESPRSWKLTPFRKAVLVLTAGAGIGVLTASARLVYWWLAEIPRIEVDRLPTGYGRLRAPPPPPPPGKPRRTL
jgi:beta-lactamase regulating signal transducer with metallopeptidase domain